MLREKSVGKEGETMREDQVSERLKCHIQRTLNKRRNFQSASSSSSRGQTPCLRPATDFDNERKVSLQSLVRSSTVSDNCHLYGAPRNHRIYRQMWNHVLVKITRIGGLEATKMQGIAAVRVAVWTTRMVCDHDDAGIRISSLEIHETLATLSSESISSWFNCLVL